MTSGVPWQSKEVRRRTRRAACEAARHCGISVGDWLDRIILDAASKQGIDPERLKQPRDGTYEDTPDENPPPPCCFDGIVGPLRDDLAGIRDALRGSVPSETFLGIVQALQQLSRKIANLIQKLEASDARLNHLEAIERELAEVLIHIARQRTANRSPPTPMPAPDLHAIAHDIAELRESEKKVQGSLELIQGALAHVIDRLALIEINMSNRVAPAQDALPSVAARADPLAPVAATTSNAPIASEAPATPAAVEPACTSGPTPSHLPIRPKLSREDAAESDSGAAGIHKPLSPAAHFLGSEAPIGTLKLSVLPDHGGRSDLIAAARRAAQGASGTVTERDDESAGSKIARSAPASAMGSPRAWLGAIAATLIVLGLLQIARILVIAFDERTTSAPSYTATTPDAVPSAVPGPAPAGQPALAAPLAPLLGRPATVFSGIDRGTVAAPPAIDAFIPGSALEPEATGKVQPSSGLTSGSPAARSTSAPAPSGISPDLELAATRRAQ
jgi:localization factor PodJL